MIMEWDDFGADHIIFDQCQSHDCRKILEQLHAMNGNFKCTLFAIPGEMTRELLNWCKERNSWIELAVHGFYHSSNWECEKLTYDEFALLMEDFEDMVEDYFVKGFRAPGWQISDGTFEWLNINDWWVADQSYNNDRRKDTKAYVNTNNQFSIWKPGNQTVEEVDAYHGHTWDVGWNGIYEDFEKVETLVKENQEFKFVSEFFI